ncbi:hypothetical protein ACSHWC_03785 [Pseudomonas fluorescens]
MARQQVKIPLPPIRDDDSGYNYLSKLADFIFEGPENFYTFDFSRCSTISHNGLVVIGGLCDFLKQHETSSSMLKGFGLRSFFSKKKVGFNIDSINPRLMEKLRALGFWNFVNPDHGFLGSTDYIGYREHNTVLEDSIIISHLQDNWLTDEKLSISELLKSEIVSSIYEIFVNAYGHGLKENTNNQSVISCGHYDPKEKRLSLSVLDFGGGIVNSVQRHVAIPHKEDAFNWALEVGNSTRTDSAPDIPRGLGFGILQEFISLNRGVLRICSDSYMATVDDSGSYVTTKVDGCFLGTLVSITVNCDNKHYRLMSEAQEKLPNYF